MELWSSIIKPKRNKLPSWSNRFSNLFNMLTWCVDWIRSLNYKMKGHTHQSAFFFTWPVVLGKIRTVEQLRYCHVIIVDWCFICKLSRETMDHFLHDAWQLESCGHWFFVCMEFCWSYLEWWLTCWHVVRDALW